MAANASVDQHQAGKAAVAKKPRASRRKPAAAAPPGDADADAPVAPRFKPPYQVRGALRQFDDQIVDYAEIIFSKGLDGEDEEAPPAGAAACAAADSSSVAATSEAAAATDADSSSASDGRLEGEAAEAYSSKDEARARRGKKRAETVSKHMSYDAWLEQHAEAVTSFRAAARQLGLEANRLLAFIFRSSHTHLLSPTEEGGDQLQFEASLAALRQLLGILGVPASALPAMLRACPKLLLRQPAAEAVEHLAQLFGGTRQLADACLHNPNILLVKPTAVEWRLTLVALHMHCDVAAAAQLLASFPALLSVNERTITANARFLGTLLPLRPYCTLVTRFPQLLAKDLGATLSALQQRAPPDMAALDLTLLASQQPTILLTSAASTIAVWRQLQQTCEQVGGWREEWRLLTRPVLTQQQQLAEEEGQHQGQQQEQQHEASSSGSSSSSGQAEVGEETDDWLQDVYLNSGSSPDSSPDSGRGMDGDSSSTHSSSMGSSSSGSTVGGADDDFYDGTSAGSSSRNGRRQVQRQQQQQQQAPPWFHQDKEGAAAAAEPGAFGTLERPWRDDDRLRARQLARLLDARPWQLQRLVFLAEQYPEEAGQQLLLDVVMMTRHEFSGRHPAFLDWLMERERQEALVKQEAAAARAAERAAAAAAALGIAMPEAEAAAAEAAADGGGTAAVQLAGVAADMAAADADPAAVAPQAAAGPAAGDSSSTPEAATEP